MAKNSKDIRPQSAPQGGKAKNKKKKKKHTKLFVVFTFLFCIFVSAMLTFIIVGSNVLTYATDFIDGGIVLNLDDYKDNQNQTSIMYAYDSNNNVIEVARLHGEENRIWVDYDEMPKELLWSFVYLEDKRFYEHNGVDWIRTIGVLVKPQYKGQGGSTITQQLIKNLTDDNEATFNRKFGEILRALNLEKNYSKKEILEAYLNTVSLGAGCYGVKTAAETYFGKEVSELTLLECATLAGITQAPYSQNPYADYDECMNRKDQCLEEIWKAGKITEERKNKLQAKKTKVLEKGTSSSTNTNTNKGDGEILSWYEEYVIDQVIKDLQTEYDYDKNEAWRKVYYGGLNIYAAVDLEAQKVVEDSYENRKGFPYSHTDKDGNLPDSSIVIMDYEGRIVALAGGTGKKTTNRGYNRATDVRAKRQPGSSIKPLSVYAPGVDLGVITASSVILEEAIILPNGDEWPRNFNGDHGSGEYITVEEALVRSLNTVPARILEESLGIKPAFRYCNENFHLNLSAYDADRSPLAVGGTNTGVTTLEMAAAFATFGNGGRYFEPYSYYKVTDRKGNVILDRTNEQPEQAIKDSTAQSLLGMLTKAVTQSNGTGYGSKISGFQTFAKTGTTSDNCDKWYCGGTPYYVASVWYGFNERADLRTGTSNPSKNIFRHIFSQIHQGLPSKSFTDTENAVDAIVAMGQEG